MKLSILVLSVPSRFDLAPALLEELCKQADGKPVEVLCLFDNKRRSVGEKRNAILGMARGDYVAFIDDDDWVSPDYVDQILSGTESNPDVVVFDHELTIDGGPPKLCEYGRQFHTVDTPERYQGKPAHTHAWRRSLAQSVEFEGVNFAEDSTWARRLCAKAKTEYQVGKVLYFYRFDSRRTETR